MTTYLLPEDFRNELLAYLMSKPYSEVANGIRRLEQLERAGKAPEVAPVRLVQAEPKVE